MSRRVAYQALELTTSGVVFWASCLAVVTMSSMPGNPAEAQGKLLGRRRCSADGSGSGARRLIHALEEPHASGKRRTGQLGVEVMAK